jgi:hypothetical protein
VRTILVACNNYTDTDARAQAFDLVMDQDAKTRWQRAKPPGAVIGLPGYLVGGEFIGVSPASPPQHIFESLNICIDYG